MASIYDGILDTAGKLIRLAPRLLMAQSTTRPHKAVALQAAEADGALHTKTLTGSTTAVTQAVAADLNATVTPVGSVGGAAASALSAVSARLPRARTRVYDAGPPALSVTATPLRNGVTVVWVGAAAESVVVSGRENAWTVTITSNNGVSTLASITAALSVSPAAGGTGGQVLAASLIALSGSAGTFPAGFAGGTDVLWEAETVGAALAVELTDSGIYVPRTMDRRVETLYKSPADVAVLSTQTWLSPWLNVEQYASVGLFVYNNAGTNAITGLLAFWAETADGTGSPGAVGTPGVNAVVSIGNNTAYYTPLSPWNSASASTLVEALPKYRGIRIALNSAANTIGRVTVLGRRAR